MTLVSGSEAITANRSRRFRFVDFEVRIWRCIELLRFTLPVPVFLKRLAAPLCVFSFGMEISTMMRNLPEHVRPGNLSILAGRAKNGQMLELSNTV